MCVPMFRSTDNNVRACMISSHIKVMIFMHYVTSHYALTPDTNRFHAQNRETTNVLSHIGASAVACSFAYRWLNISVSTDSFV